SVEISGLPCSTDINGNPVPTTVVVPVGGSSDAIVCEVGVTCPAGTNITVTVTGTAVPSASVACALDSRGQPIRTAPSTCSASVACQALSCSIAGDTPVRGNTTHSYGSTASPAGGTVTHNWSVGGNGIINGSTTGASVSVTAGASGSFTLTDNLTRNGSPGRCDLTVTVNACNPKICVTEEVVCSPSGGVCGDGLPYCGIETGMTGAGFCYRVIVENCGNDVLNDVTVTNADLGSGSLPGFPTTLGIGEKATNFFPKTWSSDGTHDSTATASGVSASSGLRTNATSTVTVVVVPIGVACDITVTSPFDQDNNPNDN